MIKLKKHQKQKLELAILLVIAIISLFIWNTYLLYPFKMFVIIIHEFSHGIAAILTGGKVTSLDVYWNLGGETRTTDGIKFVIAFMGYTGSLLFGSGLFYSAYNKNFSKWFLPISSIAIIILTANFMSHPAGIIFSLILASLLYVMPKLSPKYISSYFLKVLGLLSILYSVYDIKTDLLTLSLKITDAQLLSEMTGVSSFLWGILWFSASIATLFFLLRLGYLQGYKNK